MESETRRDKFVRLAENRTNKIIDQLGLLGNLSNSSVYEYSQKDVNKMFKAIEDAMSESRKRFSKQNEKEQKRFSFDD